MRERVRAVEGAFYRRSATSERGRAGKGWEGARLTELGLHAGERASLGGAAMALYGRARAAGEGGDGALHGYAREGHAAWRGDSA